MLSATRLVLSFDSLVSFLGFSEWLNTKRPCLHVGSRAVKSLLISDLRNPVFQLTLVALNTHKCRHPLGAIRPAESRTQRICAT